MRVLSLLAGAGALLLSVTSFAPQSADAQIRQLQRAIQKNIQTAVNRQRLNLRIEKSAGPVQALDISGDGRYMISISGDGKPRLWDLRAGRQVRQQAAIGGGGAYEAAFASDGRRFAILDRAGTLSLWAVDKPETLGAIQTGGSATSVALSPDGAAAAVGFANGEVQIFNLTTLTAERRYEGSGSAVTTLDYGATGQFILTANNDSALRIIEANSGAVVREVRVSGTLTHASFGVDEAEFLTGTSGGEVARWRVDSDSAETVFSGAEQPIVDMAISEDGATVVAVEDQKRLFIWNVGNPGDAIVVPAHFGGIQGVGFDSRPNRIVTFGDDGVTRIWDREEGALVIQLISTERGWAVVDSEGRFDGSSRALANLSWANEILNLPVDNFTDQLYEPDLLQKKQLGNTDYLSPGLENWDEGILPPPQARIDLDAQIQMPAVQPIEVSVSALDEGGGITTVNLYHNSKLVSEELVIARNESKQDGKRLIELVYRIRPVAGQNQFNANALSDESIAGMTAEAITNVVAPPRAPELHVLTIGINNYLDPELNLNYAIPDATAVQQMMEQRYGQIFADIHTYQLYDADATVRGINAALSGLQDTAPEDVVVIYYAGHGEASEEDFFFITYEFELPLSARRVQRRALSSDKLKKLIEAIGARRVILLIDACKSGTAVAGFQDQQDRRIIRQMGQSVGLHIVSATAKEQFAVEHETLGHGVFTYTLIEAMNGAADLEPSDGNLTVREIVNYSEDLVPALSQQYANYQHWPLIFSKGLNFTLGKTGS